MLIARWACVQAHSDCYHGRDEVLRDVRRHPRYVYPHSSCTRPPHRGPSCTALIGYWLAPFCAILLTEHVLFRRRSFAAYDVAGAWDTPSHPDLASPWPGLATVAVTVALVTLCMQQAWWTGPVAARGTGDVGMLVSFVACVGVYAAARALELRWRKARRGESAGAESVEEKE